MIKNYFTVQNKKYYYTIKLIDSETSKVTCPAAKINQEFLNSDIPMLINDLPNLVVSEKKYKEKNSTIIRFRVTEMDKAKIEKNALKKGYNTISSYLRAISLK
jgi:hypothetical protein